MPKKDPRRFTLAGLDDDDLLRVPEVASAVGKSTRSVLRWLDEPDGLAFVRVRGSRLIRVGTLRRFIRAGETVAAPRRAVPAQQATA